MNKSRRFLRGARKRRPDLDWQVVDRVARNFKTDDMGDIAERGYLFQLARDLPANAQCVEIGSWMGVSTCFIAAGLKGDRAKVYAVDDFQGGSSDGPDAAMYRRHFQRLGVNTTLEAFKANAARVGVQSKLEPVISRSAEATEKLKHLRGTIDFVFVDGDHSYDGCRRDIELWTPFLKKGGVIAFHDFGSRAFGVTKSVFESIKAGRFAEIVGVGNSIIAFRV